MSDLSLHDAIFSTRAMRHLKSDPVPREDLEYLVEAATMAPSAGNLQMWGFVIVTELEQRTRLASLHREIGYQYIRDEILGDPNTDADQGIDLSLYLMLLISLMYLNPRLTKRRSQR